MANESLKWQLEGAIKSIRRAHDTCKGNYDVMRAISVLGVALRNINDLDADPLIDKQKCLAVRSVAVALQTGSKDANIYIDAISNVLEDLRTMSIALETSG